MEKERYAILPVESWGALGAIRRFLSGLLEKKLVDALLVPLELPAGDNAVPTIVSNPEQIQRAKMVIEAPEEPVAQIEGEVVEEEPFEGEAPFIYYPEASELKGYDWKQAMEGDWSWLKELAATELHYGNKGAVGNALGVIANNDRSYFDNLNAEDVWNLLRDRKLADAM